MPIYSPTGFLDITNATLRTSNLEAQNFKLNGGNIYVTSELTTDELLNLDNVVNAGNATSNTVQFTNLTTGLVADSNIVVTGNVTAGSFLGDGSGLTSIPPSAITGTLSQWSDGTNSDVYIASNVGIGNVHTLTSNTLQVGANLYVRDADANVLTVTGNVAADYFEGDGSKLTGISSTLQAITDSGNVTSNTVQFSNATTGFVTTSNIEVGGALKINTITAAAYHSLQAVTNVGNVTSNTVQFSNATTGLVTTGNVEVGRDLSVTGNLTVLGTRTIVDTDTLRVKDPIIELGKDNPGTGDLGLVMTRPSGSSNVGIIFDESESTLEIGYTESNASDTDITMRTAATEPLDVNVNGNVSVGKDLTVSGNVADLNVVSNVNMLHTANTASIKLNSNVVTEFPRSKKLIKYPRVVLTANGLNQGYTVSGSDDYSTGLTFYGAFTPPTTLSSPSGAWLTPTSGTTGYSTSTGEYLLSAQLHNGSLTGEYVQIVLPERINPVYFTVQPRPESANNNQGLISCIKEGEIWASNDSGTTWTPVGTIQNFIPTGLYQEYIIDNFNVPGYYDTFALIIHKNNGQTFAGVGEWKIFGTPEYDPEAHGTDVVVKSVTNVPNTDWLEVYYDAKDLADGSTTVNDLKPTGTANNGVANGNLSVSDGAFTFDGSGDYISSTVTTTTGAFTHTFAFWMNIPSSASTTSSLVGFGTSSSDEASAIRFDGAEKFRWYFWGNDIKFTTPNVRDKWVHVVATYDGGNDSGLTVGNVGVNRKIFINTKETTVIENVSGGAGSDALNLLSTSYVFKVGSDLSNGNTLTGKIANVRLFNRVLTQDEIYQLYAYQKEYFGHGDLSMTLKAGRLGIGTSEPQAALDVYGELYGPRTKPCFSIHTDDYWGADDVSWGTASGTHWATVYKTPIPCVRRGWLEYDTHNAISFRDVTRGSNTGTIVKFTAPRSGFYHFSFNIGFKTGVAGDYLAFMLNKNQEDSINGPDPNDYFLGVIHDHVTAKAYTLGVSVNIYLKAGEFVVPYSRSAQNIYICNGGGFNFSGFYIG